MANTLNYTIADGEFYKQFKVSDDEMNSYGKLVEGEILSFSDAWYYIEWITEQEYNDLLALEDQWARGKN